MKYIDERFKDAKPEDTVALIKSILSGLGITLTEDWNETGIDDCWGVRVSDQANAHGTNGKGISKEFAMASAYGEFIERLCLGKFFYKKQSLTENPSTNLQTFAPDARYMTIQELIENGEWMDYIIAEYGNGLTREKLAKQCVMYAGREPVLTVPYYSLFEDKYVYIPTEFEEHIYSANGSCAGNSRNEAWVHALSEILERHNCIQHIISGIPLPAISEEKLKNYSTVVRILDKIKETGNFEVKIFDLSLGLGFPVIATRIIDKSSHSYMVDVGADPIPEIAIQRTLTETFQGQSLNKFTPYCTNIPNDIKSIHTANNILNQLETGHGLFPANFFAEEIYSDESPFDFVDNTGKSNSELLNYMLNIYKKLGKPVYVRNCSFLGFPCYRFIVPGFSESRGQRLIEPIQQYAFGKEASNALKNIRSASDEMLENLLIYRKMIRGVFTRECNFESLVGLPLASCDSAFLLNMHYAYAYSKLNKITDCLNLLNLASISARNKENSDYAACARQYLEFAIAGKQKSEIVLILNKFYSRDVVKRLEYNFEEFGDVFGDYLIKCDFENCEDCKFKSLCHLEGSNKLVANVGAKYKQFVDGQNKENFII